MKRTIILAAFAFALGATQASACEWHKNHEATATPVTVADNSSGCSNCTVDDKTASEPAKSVVQEPAAPVAQEPAQSTN
jgi:hypothetical protein